MPRDISHRFVVMHRGWPVDSDDDEVSARTRMQELQERQRASLARQFLFRAIDISELWQLIDTAG
jgi:hypothetical protein